MNWLAIILSAVATMIVGAIWYSPKVLGSMWMKLEGISVKDMDAAKKEMPKMYIGMFVASLVMAYVMAKFVSMTILPTMTVGVLVAFWAWLGFVATSFFNNTLASGRPMKLFMIQAGYYLVTFLIVGAIIGAMH